MGMQVLVHSPCILALLSFTSCGLREWAPCSGFFFLFSHFLLIKAALLYIFSNLTKCHIGEDWPDVTQMSLSRDFQFFIYARGSIIFLCPLEPGLAM